MMSIPSIGKSFRTSSMPCVSLPSHVKDGFVRTKGVVTSAMKDNCRSLHQAARSRATRQQGNKGALRYTSHVRLAEVRFIETLKLPLTFIIVQR